MTSETAPARPDADADAPRLVVYLPTGRDQTLVTRLLARRGVACQACEDVEQLLEAVRDGVGPVLVAQEGLRGAAERLAEALDDQPAWSDLPVLVLISRVRTSRSLEKALSMRPAVRWLQRPLRLEPLLTTVRLAIESRQRQLQVADHLRQEAALNDRLAARAAELRELTVSLIEAEDRERARLAELLHDDLQGLLVSAQLHLRAAEKRADDPQALRETFNTVEDLLRQAQDASRNTSHELYPAALRQEDLIDLLRWLAPNAQRLAGIEVSVSTAYQQLRVRSPILRFVYRSIREILCNVAKHAEVGTARIEVRVEADQLEVCVCDEGVGFDPRRINGPDRAGGLGLMAVSERARMLGGQMQIDSRPGAGTRITLIIPEAVVTARKASEADQSTLPFTATKSDDSHVSTDQFQSQ